jgi:hypothetical protein
VAPEVGLGDEVGDMVPVGNGDIVGVEDAVGYGDIDGTSYDVGAGEMLGPEVPRPCAMYSSTRASRIDEGCDIESTFRVDPKSTDSKFSEGTGVPVGNGEIVGVADAVG